MAALKGPQFVIDSVAPFLTGQSQVVGPVPGDFKVVEAVFHGDTATIPVLAVGTYVNGVFTVVTTLCNGLNGAGTALGTTQTALQPGVEVTLTASGPITSGQYIKVTSGTNALARWTLNLVPSSTAAGLAVDTTPA